MNIPSSSGVFGGERAKSPEHLSPSEKQQPGKALSKAEVVGKETLGGAGSHISASLSGKTIIPQQSNVQSASFLDNLKVLRGNVVSNCQNIPVLDQRLVGDYGEEECGIHAFKNALLALGLGFGIAGADVAFLQDEDFYKVVQEFVVRSNPELASRDVKDVTIFELIKSLEALKNASPDEISEQLKPFRQLYQDHPHSISIFNRKEGCINVGGDYSILRYLANLKDVASCPSPLIHVFILGTNQHWITLLLHKGADGSFDWYGFDSDGWRVSEESNHYRGHIAFLAEVLCGSAGFIKRAYNEAVGNDFAARGEDFWSDNLAEEIAEAYALMQRVGWLDKSDVIIDKHKKSLYKIADFASNIGVETINVEGKSVSIQEIKSSL